MLDLSAVVNRSEHDDNSHEQKNARASSGSWSVNIVYIVRDTLALVFNEVVEGRYDGTASIYTQIEERGRGWPRVFTMRG